MLFLCYCKFIFVWKSLFEINLYQFYIGKYGWHFFKSRIVVLSSKGTTWEDKTSIFFTFENKDHLNIHYWVEELMKEVSKLDLFHCIEARRLKTIFFICWSAMIFPRDKWPEVLSRGNLPGGGHWPQHNRISEWRTAYSSRQHQLAV